MRNQIFAQSIKTTFNVAMVVTSKMVVLSGKDGDRRYADVVVMGVVSVAVVVFGGYRSSG